MPQNALETVKVHRLYLDIASQIERQIRQGDIEPGTRLPSERDLAVSFGVSRPTIREAMIALEIAELVEIRTGSGIYALTPSTNIANANAAVEDVPGPFEILEARLIIEAECSALAAARITDTKIADLERAVSIMASGSSSDKEKERADQLFHCTIAEATNNSALLSSVKWLWDMRNRSEISLLFHQRVRDLGVHPSVEEHKKILSALKARDPGRARNAMQTHISNAIDQDVSVLELES